MCRALALVNPSSTSFTLHQASMWTKLLRTKTLSTQWSRCEYISLEVKSPTGKVVSTLRGSGAGILHPVMNSQSCWGCKRQSIPVYATGLVRAFVGFATREGFHAHSVLGRAHTTAACHTKMMTWRRRRRKKRRQGKMMESVVLSASVDCDVLTEERFALTIQRLREPIAQTRHAARTRILKLCQRRLEAPLCCGGRQIPFQSDGVDQKEQLMCVARSLMIRGRRIKQILSCVALSVREVFRALIASMCVHTTLR